MSSAPKTAYCMVDLCAINLTATAFVEHEEHLVEMITMRAFVQLIVPISLAGWLFLGCQSGIIRDSLKSGAGASATDASADADPDAIPFTPVSAAVYVNKVKRLITGRAATADEIAQGANDDGLSALVDTWMASDSYQDTLMTFFGLAFQTNKLTLNHWAPVLNYNGQGFGNDSIIALEEVIPRTARWIVNSNMPFNSIVTTTRFMVTPLTLQLYALFEGSEVSDQGVSEDTVLMENPNFTMRFDPFVGDASIETVTNPQSPRYFEFYFPNLSPAPSATACPYCYTCMQRGGTTTVTPDLYTYGRAGDMWWILRNESFVYFMPGSYFCYIGGKFDGGPFMQASDGTDWRLVDLAQSGYQGKGPNVWDLTTFRTASQLTMRQPHIGYLTDPAFLMQVPTNINNQARSTINQAMIVGLGAPFDGTDTTIPPDLSALPTAHAAPHTSCYGCHVTMDPMRQYFRQALTVAYHRQLDPNEINLTASFGHSGVTATNGGLATLAEKIATSPKFATAWTRKVCQWLNSGDCLASDPEVIRVSTLFAQSNFNFNVLFKAMITSPLTTYKTASQTASHRGAIVTIARRDQLCQTLSARLDYNDICALRPGDASPGAIGGATALLSEYPYDSYSRGSAALVQPSVPSLISRIGLETICGYVAAQVVDNNTKFNSTDPNVLDYMLTNFMGLVLEDNTDIRALLQAHFDAVVAQTTSKKTALQSSFVLACLSPYVSMVGQ